MRVVRRGGARSALQEVEQHAVELLGVAHVEPVRAVGDDVDGGVLHRLTRALAGDLERHDGVAVAVDDERRHVDLLEVVTEVGGAEGLDAAEHGRRRRGLDERDGLLTLGLGDLELVVGAEEVRGELLEEAGVSVKAVRYFTSQPWPFPATLMIGCFAMAEDLELDVNLQELEWAQWFSKKEVEALFADQNEEFSAPRSIAIAHHLIKHWLKHS